MALQNYSYSHFNSHPNLAGIPTFSDAPLQFDQVGVPPRLPDYAYSQQAPATNNNNNNPFSKFGNRGSQSPGRPDKQIHYSKVNSASQSGSKTSLHAVLDYDEEEVEGETNDFYYPAPGFNGFQIPSVTPIQGPIFIRNDSVPVVPLYSYPKVNNGTLVQIPIMWAALQFALGFELKGDFIRGAPCIKKNHQLFCPSAGTTYPSKEIEKFIDDNKALMRRMYGEFETDSVEYASQTVTTSTPKYADRYNNNLHAANPSQRRNYKRQALPKFPTNDNGRVDTCESKLEVVTPYWASNSAGKIRAVVNTQHFEQAIHQEVCSKSETARCNNDCRCEQKYKWHRLLAYDPDNDCKGIFMDWFLFPSCCVCRCSPPKSAKSD